MKGLVWGLTFVDGCKKMDEIREKYLLSNYKIVGEHRTQQRYDVVFDNGDQWRVMRASENSRGVKGNLSYVDGRIQDNSIIEMIQYCTTAGPWNAIKFYYWA